MKSCHYFLGMMSSKVKLILREGYNERADMKHTLSDIHNLLSIEIITFGNCWQHIVRQMCIYLQWKHVCMVEGYED